MQIQYSAKQLICFFHFDYIMIICFRSSKSSEKKNKKPQLATPKKSPEPPAEPTKPTNPVITHKTTPKTGPR